MSACFSTNLVIFVRSISVWCGDLINYIFLCYVYKATQLRKFIELHFGEHMNDRVGSPPRIRGKDETELKFIEYKSIVQNFWVRIFSVTVCWVRARKRLLTRAIPHNQQLMQTQSEINNKLAFYLCALSFCALFLWNYFLDIGLLLGRLLGEKLCYIQLINVRNHVFTFHALKLKLFTRQRVALDQCSLKHHQHILLIQVDFY